MDPFAILQRDDKWFLGGGFGAIYAPPFPKHLNALGFWDECYLADIRIPHLFTILLTDEIGHPIRILSSKIVTWRPDCLELKHETKGFSLVERRCVTAENAWVTELTLENAPGPIRAFLWSLLDMREPGIAAPWSSVTDVTIQSNSLSVRFDTCWPNELEPDRSAIEAERIEAGASKMGSALPIFLSFGASDVRESWTVNLAQRHDESPLYETSVLPQKLKNGQLVGDFKVKVGSEPDGLLHSVQQFSLQPDKPLRFSCGSGLSADEAELSLQAGLDSQVFEKNHESWARYFQAVPQFESSDPWLTHAYWYRWFGLRLSRVDICELPIAEGKGMFLPYVTEGIGFFRNFVSYSAQAHLREVSWMHDPSLALGILGNLSRCQREDGSYPGHNYSCRPSRDFYHADFATGIQQLEKLHNVRVSDEVVQSMARYGDYYLRERHSPFGMVIFDQNETGQEYMSRYQFVTESADKWVAFKVVGVDATTYGCILAGWLSQLQNEGRLTEVQTRWTGHYVGLKRSLAGLFDPSISYFLDRKLEGERSWAKPATGMYPMLVASELEEFISTSTFLEIADRWLLNSDQFWLEKGLPATTKSDPTFSADGEWKERRLNCPWSGRSWPMANSHLVDGMANVALNAKTEIAKQKAGQVLMKAIKLMFHDGDPSRPNSYEHYDPVSGVPALYRGYDDYMHSWIVDLILRHAVGVQPGVSEVLPLTLDVDWIECSAIPNMGKRMHVRIERGLAPRVTWE